MQAKMRYFLLFVYFLLAICSRYAYQRIKFYFNPISNEKFKLRSTKIKEKLVEFDFPYENDGDIVLQHNLHQTRKIFGRNKTDGTYGSARCTMNSCFNVTPCMTSFKIHVYPEENEVAKFFGGKSLIVSKAYRKIMNVLRRSNLLTNDPRQACLFILSYDTLDRDVLSSDYVKNLNATLYSNLSAPWWNKGLNHVIFNLYPGTWPDYNPLDFGFDVGKAIIAKASFSLDHFRPNFDISLPLFHSTLPESEDSAAYNDEKTFKLNVPACYSTSYQASRRSNDKSQNCQHSYLLSFKGKRYVQGIGSETRNSLYHLHNGRDVIMLTTCRHGKDWMKIKDERCDADNSIYDNWDYNGLLRNSTFCLIPRGRRLGSFRFLEALEAGCIPVVLSNGWQLPFSEIIDWKSSVIWADERALFQITDFLRSIPSNVILRMKREAKRLSHSYFATVEKIVMTTLKIIRNRLKVQSDSESRRKQQ